MNQAIAALVRRHDPDRFLTALFAPPEKRDALLTLYAFNHELARAREAVSEPRAGADPAAMVARGGGGCAPPPRSRRTADRRDRGGRPRPRRPAGADRCARDRGGTVDRHVWKRGARISWTTPVGWSVAAARMLGAPDPEALRRLGAAYGVAGLLRSIPAHARQGRCLLPGDVLAEHGLTREQVIANPIAAPIEPVICFLARQGLALLDRPVRLPRGVVAAALPAVLARRDLRQAPAFAVYRGLGDRMAVMRAGLRGRV